MAEYITKEQAIQSLNGLRRQVNECLDNAYNKGYQDGKSDPQKIEPSVNAEIIHDNYIKGQAEGYARGKEDGYKEGYKIGQEELACDKRFDSEHIKKLINKASSEGYENGYRKGFEDGSRHEQEIWKKELKEVQDATTDIGYSRGLEKAWECARKISDMKALELDEIFTTHNDAYIFAHNTISEAIAKINEYEEKKQAEEIKVFGVVFFTREKN